MLRGMWDLPGPGLEPVSPALAGGFLTTERATREAPGKVLQGLLLIRKKSNKEIRTGLVRLEEGLN